MTNSEKCPLICCANCVPGSIDMLDALDGGVAAKCPSCGILHPVPESWLQIPGAEELGYVTSEDVDRAIAADPEKWADNIAKGNVFIKKD
jgi:hypothetical protein